MTPAEIMLWQFLRNRGLDGYKFRRQHSIDNYIVDFYCTELRFAIEVDGESHFFSDAEVRDKKRDGQLRSRGVYILRVPNTDVQINLDGVLLAIRQVMKRLRTTRKPPPVSIN